jgi:hypothetical protein
MIGEAVGRGQKMKDMDFFLKWALQTPGMNHQRRGVDGRVLSPEQVAEKIRRICKRCSLGMINTENERL